MIVPSLTISVTKTVMVSTLKEIHEEIKLVITLAMIMITASSLVVQALILSSTITVAPIISLGYSYPIQIRTLYATISVKLILNMVLDLLVLILTP